MATSVTITTGEATTKLSVSTSARGPQGTAGANGADGSDAEVTEANITAALGYTPGDPADYVTVATLSTNGGANKVPKFDASGNLYTGPLDNRVGGDYLASGFGSSGNIYIPDQQGLVWRDPADGSTTLTLRHWRGHDAVNGETIFESQWRLAMLAYGPVQFGHNDVLPTAQVLHIASGESSASRPISHSRAVSWQTRRDNSGGTERVGWVTAQATSLAEDSDSTVLRFAIKDENYSGGTGPVEGFAGGGGTYTKGTSLGTDMAEFSSSGIWHTGQAPTYDALSDGAITQTCSKYKTIQAATVTLTQASTLTISNATAGMRGVLYVTQDGTGSHTLTPTGGSALSISTAPLTTDRVAWEYDGTYYNFDITQAIERAVIVGDSDAQAFITAASITDAGQKVAINTLVESLKSASLWTKFYALYPFVGGTSAAHAVNLKNPGTYDITWNNDNVARHTASGVNGDIASSFYGDSNFNYNTVAAQDSASSYIYCKTASPTTGTYFTGAVVAASPRWGMNVSTTNLQAQGPNSNTANTFSRATGGSFANHLALNRASSTAISIYVGTGFQTGTNTSTGATVPDQAILALNTNGVYSAYSDAEIAFCAFGASLSDSEWQAFFPIITTFQTALGRQN